MFSESNNGLGLNETVFMHKKCILYNKVNALMYLIEIDIITYVYCTIDSETLTIAIKQSLKMTAVDNYHFLANILSVKCNINKKK